MPDFVLKEQRYQGEDRIDQRFERPADVLDEHSILRYQARKPVNRVRLVCTGVFSQQVGEPWNFR